MAKPALASHLCDFFLDAMFYKAKKDNVVVTKVIYNVMGINQHGHKDILGFYDCESEGAHFWLGVLNDLKTLIRD